jgi:uncharacterized protein (DUF1499 family)
MDIQPTSASSVSRVGIVAVKTVFWLSIAAAVMASLTGPGNRLGWWNFGTAFTMLRWAAITGGVLAALALVALFWSLRQRRTPLVAQSIIAALIGLLTIGLPMQLVQRGRTVPAIHDISTDTSHPPAFVALAAMRATVPNGVEYGGPIVAAAQLEAYPDITPLTLAARPEDALSQCLSVARALGWEIVATSQSDLRIEATDTTPFFAFKDDIIIRITPAGPASRVDLRSVSRVGRSDLGANARRIREFYRLLARMQRD